MNKNNSYLDKLVPVRMVGIAWFLVSLIWLLPNGLLGLIGRIIVGVALVIVTVASFSETWKEYEFLGAFTVLNILYFAIILFSRNVDWLVYISVFLIIISFQTIFSHISTKNRSNETK